MAHDGISKGEFISNYCDGGSMYADGSTKLENHQLQGENQILRENNVEQVTEVD